MMIQMLWPPHVHFMAHFGLMLVREGWCRSAVVVMSGPFVGLFARESAFMLTTFDVDWGRHAAHIPIDTEDVWMDERMNMNSVSILPIRVNCWTDPLLSGQGFNLFIYLPDMDRMREGSSEEWNKWICGGPSVFGSSINDTDVIYYFNLKNKIKIVLGLTWKFCNRNVDFSYSILLSLL